MKILFVLQHSGYLRNYTSTIIELARRGHSVTLGFSTLKDKLDNKVLVDQLLSAEPNVSQVLGKLPVRRDNWVYFLAGVRGGRDYVRYLTPLYVGANALRARIESRLPRFLVSFFKAICYLAPVRGPALLDTLLHQVERAIPPDPGITNWLRLERPDVLLITPLTDFASDQVDYIKSARALSLPSALCVHSWDNLTNKGLMRVLPNRVFVWNDNQKGEAVSMHGVAPEHVVVTGAQCYDKWFSGRPSTTRQEFLARVGLPEEGKALILYLCSSPFIAPKEVSFVRSWLASLRTDERLRGVNVLIRPHPQNAAQWANVQFAGAVGVSVWPRAGANPISEDANKGYYDSVFYCDVVVGLNTSAMIEAGILGKPVFTVLDPEFAGTQEGTLHFQHLLRGGLLHIAEDFDVHRRQVLDTLTGNVRNKDSLQAFIRDFVRPYGLETDCTPVLADGIESLSSLPSPAEDRAPRWGVFLRFIVYPVALALEKMSLASKPKKRARGGWRKPRDIFKAMKRSKFLPAARTIRRILPLKEVSFKGVPAANDYAADCRSQLRRIAAGNQLIVVGPWVSEVGFELLYWIPFLRWAQMEFGLPSSRIVAVSRGGAASWYEGIAGHYLDAFECYTPGQFRRKNDARIKATGGQKHNLVSDIDKELLSWVKMRLGENAVDWIHPKLMYDLFTDFWRRRATVSLVETHTRFCQLALPCERPELRLPADFIVVKFYFSAAFPDTDENRKFVSRLVKRLAQRTYVVILNTGLKVDDHDDFPVLLSDRVISIAASMNPANNLAIQTYVISRSRAFFGTYGGFSYLPPFLGVPSFGFYSSEGKFLPVHLDIAHRAYRTIKYGSFDKLLKGRTESSVVFRGLPEFHAMSTAGIDALIELCP